MDFKEKSLEKNYVYKGKIINLRKDRVLLPDGKESVREIVEHGGGAAVLCEKDGKILMVRQFRYAYGKVITEIPAGKLNAGEDPKAAAIRELEEECGVKAGDAELIFTIYPSVGYTNEIIRIYRAKEISQGKTSLDEDEFLTHCWMDKKELGEMLKKGEINDSKTIIALMFALNGQGSLEGSEK